MAETVGRPTKYTDDMLNTAYEYIKGGYIDCGHTIPSVVGLAIHLNIAKSTLYLWAENKDHPFSDMLAFSNDSQELSLINGGLSGDLNPTISKLVLAKHGYAEKQELTGKDGAALIPVSITTKYD